MDVKTAIYERRSVRKYQERPVEYDHVVDIVEAGMAAPSAGNVQECKFIVVIDEKKRQQLAQASLSQLWMSKAPVHIVVCAEFEKTAQFYGLRGERLYAIQDCAASIQNMMLMAQSLGLGTCWIGAFEEDMVRRLCNIPSDVRPQAILTIGYSDETPEKQPQYPLTMRFYFENWGSKIENVSRLFHEHSVEIKKAMDSGKGILKRAAEKVMPKKK